MMLKRRQIQPAVEFGEECLGNGSFSEWEML